MDRARLPPWTRAYAPGRSPGDPAALLSARLVAGIVDLLLIAVAVFSLVGLAQPGALPGTTKVTLAVGAALLVALRRLVRTGRARWAGIALCVIAWIAVATDLPLHGQQTVAIGGFAVLVVIGALAVGPAAAVGLAVATAALLAVFLLGLVPVHPIPIPSGAFRLTHYATQLSLMAILVAWWASHMRALLTQVRTSESQYTQLLEASPDAIVRVDLQGKVIFCNSAVERLLGYSPADLVGRGWYEAPLIRPSDLEVLRAKLDASLAGEPLPAGEIELTHRDGHLVTMDTKGYPIRREDGRVVGVVAVLRDVSDRKKAEAERTVLREQLAIAQRMETLGSFAGGIAHDFNNVLTVILNATEAAGHDVGAVDAGALADARDAAKRGAALTRQLLNFGRRKHPGTPEPTDVGKAATALRPMLGRLLGESVQICMDVEPTAPRASIEAGQFDQVLVNLVANARDAMPDGGTIRIGVRSVGGPAARGRRVAVEVHDDGAGMDAETKARIFDPFFTTKGESGTGLGLAVVHSIVHGAGGIITVESEPGRGTTFRIELPTADGDVEPAAKRASAAPPPSP